LWLLMIDRFALHLELGDDANRLLPLDRPCELADLIATFAGT
jgi:hypothetical protein